MINGEVPGGDRPRVDRRSTARKYLALFARTEVIVDGDLIDGENKRVSVRGERLILFGGLDFNTLYVRNPVNWTILEKAKLGQAEISEDGSSQRGLKDQEKKFIRKARIQVTRS